MSRIDQIRAFVCAVDSSNFSAAARLLDTSPSNISKMISKLEADVGVRLLDRSSRHVSLTEEGAVYLQTARRINDALSEHDSVVETLGKRPRGILRVSTMLTLAKYQLVPILPEFLERYPSVQLQFSLVATFDQQMDDFDIAIHSGSLPDSALVSRRIGASRWIICAAPSYLKRCGTPRTPEELSSHQCLNFEKDSPWNHWSFGNGSPPFRSKSRSRISSTQGELLLELALHGAGIVRLAEFHVENDLAAGRLVSILEDYADLDAEPIWAIYRSQRNLSPRIRVFVDYVQHHLKMCAWNKMPSRRL